MAMPLSGCISLRECIAGCNCSSISCAVAGVACTPTCLCTISVQAGKELDHAMREFYGYETGGIGSDICLSVGIPTTVVSSSNCCVICFDIDINGRQAGDVLTLCFNWDATLSKSGIVYFRTRENSGSWVGRGNSIGQSGFGDFLVTGIDSDDTIEAEIDLEGGIGTDSAMLCLSSIPAFFTTGSGTISRCTPYLQSVSIT